MLHFSYFVTDLVKVPLSWWFLSSWFWGSWFWGSCFWGQRNGFYCCGTTIAISVLAGLQSYNEFITCFDESWIYKIWVFSEAVASVTVGSEAVDCEAVDFEAGAFEANEMDFYCYGTTIAISVLTGLQSYNEFITCFDESWIDEIWVFFYEICLLFLSVIKI